MFSTSSSGLAAGNESVCRAMKTITNAPNRMYLDANKYKYFRKVLSCIVPEFNVRLGFSVDSEIPKKSLEFLRPGYLSNCPSCEFPPESKKL